MCGGHFLAIIPEFAFIWELHMNSDCRITVQLCLYLFVLLLNSTASIWIQRHYPHVNAYFTIRSRAKHSNISKSANTYQCSMNSGVYRWKVRWQNGCCCSKRRRQWHKIKYLNRILFVFSHSCMCACVLCVCVCHWRIDYICRRFVFFTFAHIRHSSSGNNCWFSVYVLSHQLDLYISVFQSIETRAFISHLWVCCI